MENTISATRARTHFGEVMRRVTEKKQTVIVERGGKPQVVILSVEAYRRLKHGQTAAEWQTLVAAAHRQIRAELGSRPLPPAEEILAETRQERDEQLSGLR